MGSILVIRGGAIGDFILTLPVLAALRRQLPQARLEVLGYGHIARLALAGGLADEVRSIEAGPLAGFFARHGTLAPELVDYFKKFNVIISYLYDPDEIFRTNVGRCTQAQFIQGPHRPEETAGVPASTVFLQPLERLAIFDADPVPHLILGEASRSESNTSRLVLHPGSGSETKNWPMDRWKNLIDQLTRRAPILVVSGEAEGQRIHSLRLVDYPAVEHAHHLPLVDLARRLQSCAAFIGHDSGISHLAAALGLPGLVLWGPSTEVVWRPPSSNVRLVRHPSGLKELPVEQVMEEINQLLAARLR